MLFFLLIHNAVNVNFRILQVYFDKKNKTETNKHHRPTKGFPLVIVQELKTKLKKKEQLGRSSKSISD